MSSELQQQNSRLALLDVFRMVSVFYLAFFHTWMVFHNAPTSVGTEFQLFEAVENFGRPLLFHSGLYVLAISFFLFGFRNKSLSAWRLPIFFFGIFLVQYRGDDSWASLLDLQSWRWGVFTFLIFVYSFLLVTQKLKWSWKLILYFSPLLLFFVQSYQVTAYLDVESDSMLIQMLTGSEIEPQLFTGWFLIPWFAYPVYFFGLGILMQRYQKFFSKLHIYMDMALFTVFGFVLIVYLKSYPAMYIDGRFNHGIFNKDLLGVATYLLIPTLIFRVSVLDFVKRLMDIKVFHFISNLNWNKHFWMAYMLHLFVIYSLFMFQKNRVWNERPFAEVMPFLALLIAELLTINVVVGFEAWKNLFKRVLERKKGSLRTP